MEEKIYRQFMESHWDEFMAFLESKMSGSLSTTSPSPNLMKEDPESH